jgi:hypothetical protein
MNFGYPATVAGGAFAVIPAAMFVVAPGGVLTPYGVVPVRAGFPFGVPFTAFGATFIAIPATTVAVTPAVI